MATYHLNIRHVSLSKGQSAKAKSNYINRNDKYSQRHDDLQYSSSGNMPNFAKENPSYFWACADQHERANARICTEIEFALPRELNLEQQKDLVQDFVNLTIDNEQRKMPYSLAIHNDRENHNPHCHLMFSTRKQDGIERDEALFFKRANAKQPEKGGASKDRDVISKEFLQSVRKTWREVANQHLEKHGYTAKIDERTLEAQGVEREAQRRINRVEYQECQSLGREIQKIGGDLTQIDRKILQEKSNIAENASKSSVERFNTKDDKFIEKNEKHSENRNLTLSQREFDEYLISNWLNPSKKLEKAQENLKKHREEYENYGKDLDKLKERYAELDEKNQGFLGLWESKAQKQGKQELRDEFERVKALYQAKGRKYNELHDSITKFEKETIEPIRKQIEKIRENNPELKMRNQRQLTTMQFEGLNAWYKRVNESKQELDRLTQKRTQERDLERKNGFSL